MSETEPEVPFEEPEPETSPDGDEPTEVPDGVDPETGEVLEDDEPGEDDAEASASAERERELAAEREEAAQQQARDDADIERKTKALNGATKRYTDKIIDILGEELDGFQPCPLCANGFPGFRIPLMPDPEHLAAVKVAIGEDPDPPLNDDPYTRP